MLLKKFRILLSLIFILGISTVVFSQVIQTERYEKEQTMFDDEFTLISLQEDGLALIKGTSKYKSGSRSWALTLVDTLLHEVYSIEFDIDNRNNLIGYEHSTGYGHFLFVRNEPNIILEIINVHLSTKEIISNKINPELNFKLTHFHKVGENFVFAGAVNQDPCVLVFNPKTESLKVVPGFFVKDTELVDVRPNQNETFNVLLFEKSNVTNRKIIFKTFDSSGNQLLEDFSVMEDNVSVQTSISSSLLREDLIVIGTWGKRNSKSASGFYAIPINPFTDDSIKQIHFGELDHYLDYLKPKRAKALKLKTKKALEANKVPDFTSHVMPYKILEHHNGFLLLAESFTPSSNQTQYYSSPYPGYSPYPYYNPYGPYYPYYGRRYSPQFYGNNVETPDENKKIESIAINIDAGGNVTWDCSMEFKDIKTRSFQNLSEIWLTKDSLYMMYKDESELKIKSVSMETHESTESAQKIKLSDIYDEVTSESSQDGSIESWYSNVFYVWGYQSIRNKTKPGGRKRVYYINKIEIK